MTHAMTQKLFCLLVSLMVLPIYSTMAQVTGDAYVIKGNSIVIEKIIPFSVSKEEASAAVKSYFLTTLNDPNITLKNSSDDYYVAKITTPVLASYSMNKWYTVGYLTIDVKFKENRMKVTISCNDILNTNTDHSIYAHYSPVEAAPINSEHDAWKTLILKKQAIETFNHLVSYMSLVVDGINSSVQNAKAEEDW